MTTTESVEPRYLDYADKEPTPLQQRFPDWLYAMTGIDPEEKYESLDEAFRDGVRLGVALRMEFQASPENRQATAKEREEREEAEEKRRQERKAAREKRDAELEAAREKRAADRKAKDEERAAKQKEAEEKRAAAAKAKEATVPDEEDEGSEETPAKPAARKSRAKVAKPAAKKEEPAPSDVEDDDEEGDLF